MILKKEIKLVIWVESYQFAMNDDQLQPETLSNREIMELFRQYNANASEKINAFQSFQSVSYALLDGKSIAAHVRNHQLPLEAIDVIIKHKYCIFQNNLYFFNDATVEELGNIFKSKDIAKTLVALRRSGNRGITEAEIEIFSSQIPTNLVGDKNVSFNIKLYPYQDKGLAWLSQKYATRKGALLADDMGLGKTAQIIALIAKGLRTGTIKSALAVVPNSLIANWSNEFKKFTTGISPYIHWGAHRAGFSQTFIAKPIVITTYTTIVNDVALFGHLNFDLVVFDEASLLKNPDSLRTQAVNQLNFGTAIAITGTPFENSMMDLWSITNVVSKDFLGTREKYTAKYVKNGLAQLDQSNLEEVELALKPILLRRMKEDVLTELPPKIDIYKPLSMGPEEQKGYQKIETSIRNSLGQQSHAFSLISDYRKYSAHPFLVDNRLGDASLDELRTSSSKFEFLDSLLKQVAIKKEKALVFANHVALIESFKKIFGSHYGWSTYKVDGTVQAEDRQSIIDEFTNSDGAAFLFLNPVTAGMGLNITSANHVIHYSRQWNPALEAQATARAYRNGQEKNVNVYYLYYAHSIEETIHNRIFLKQNVASNLIRATNEYQSEEQMILELLKEKSESN